MAWVAVFVRKSYTLHMVRGPVHLAYDIHPSREIRPLTVCNGAAGLRGRIRGTTVAGAAALTAIAYSYMAFRTVPR